MTVVGLGTRLLYQSSPPLGIDLTDLDSLVRGLFLDKLPLDLKHLKVFEVILELSPHLNYIVCLVLLRNSIKDTLNFVANSDRDLVLVEVGV